jgi:hypothetical protein
MTILRLPSLLLLNLMHRLLIRPLRPTLQPLILLLLIRPLRSIRLLILLLLIRPLRSSLLRATHRLTLRSLRTHLWLHPSRSSRLPTISQSA